jgi:hypothetical protein
MGPAIIVESVRTVANDGSHNAFTDLCRFRGRLYLAFRSCPEGHMIFPSSRIVVMESADGGTWTEVHRFGVPDRDVRDPHFLVLRDRLHVYTGTWLAAPGEAEKQELNDHRGYASWTADGRRWEGPRFLEGTQGHYVWRAAAFDGVGYLNGRKKRGFAVLTPREREWEIEESWLLRTTDGLRFEPAALVVESFGDETAFAFEDDGSAIAVARNREGSEPAFLCRSKPPYADWRRTRLARNIGGPLLARWGSRLLVGGRKTPEKGRSLTALWWLEADRIEEAAELPSGGDTSYPGFVALSPTEGLLSYYSSHEGSGTSLAPSSIYVARVATSGL